MPRQCETRGKAGSRHGSRVHVHVPVQRVDVFYLSTWITFFQIIIGFVLTPVNSLLPPAEGGVALQNVGKQFSRGTLLHPWCGSTFAWVTTQRRGGVACADSTQAPRA